MVEMIGELTLGLAAFNCIWFLTFGLGRYLQAEGAVKLKYDARCSCSSCCDVIGCNLISTHGKI